MLSHVFLQTRLLEFLHSFLVGLFQVLLLLYTHVLLKNRCVYFRIPLLHDPTDFLYKLLLFFFCILILRLCILLLNLVCHLAVLHNLGLSYVILCKLLLLFYFLNKHDPMSLFFDFNLFIWQETSKVITHMSPCVTYARAIEIFDLVINKLLFFFRHWLDCFCTFNLDILSSVSNFIKFSKRVKIHDH